MNKLSSVVNTDPYDKVSECIQFTIDDISDPFVLNNVMTVGQQYTFSLWLMSEIDASLSIAGEVFSSVNAWREHSITFIADCADLSFNFDTVGTYYIYHPQLETGNKATDWTPAPEDQSDELATRFSIELGKIEAEFESVRTTVNELGESITERYYKNITEDENGITITDSDDVFSVQVDNVEGFTIRKDGEIRSQLKDDNFYTGNMVVKTTERAQLGNFAFIPRSDGSISFLKVGD